MTGETVKMIIIFPLQKTGPSGNENLTVDIPQLRSLKYSFVMFSYVVDLQVTIDFNTSRHGHQWFG